MYVYIYMCVCIRWESGGVWRRLRAQCPLQRRGRLWALLLRAASRRHSRAYNTFGSALLCFTLRCFTLLYSALLCVEQAFEHFLKLFPDALDSEEEDKDSHSDAVHL
jgi:hypothetical protein